MGTLRRRLRHPFRLLTSAAIPTLFILKFLKVAVNETPVNPIGRMLLSDFLVSLFTAEASNAQRVEVDCEELLNAGAMGM